jgi:hypothetical protein
LFRFIFKSIVQRFSYKCVCLQCNRNFRADADVPLMEQTTPVSGADMHVKPALSGMVRPPSPVPVCMCLRCVCHGVGLTSV